LVVRERCRRREVGGGGRGGDADGGGGGGRGARGQGAAQARFEARILSVGPEKQPDNKKPDEAVKKPAAGEEAKKQPPPTPPCCAGCSACRPPLVPVPAHAYPFPGAVVCYEEQAAGNGCVIL
jgi:hypothetical protein